MEKHEAMMLYCLAGLVVKDTGGTIENLLADASNWAEGIIPQPTKENAQDAKETAKELESDIEEIYKAYPSKCPRRMQSTGKCSKDKERIRILLTRKHKTKDEILKAIQQTINEGAYLKNFSTFLNNLPEIEEELQLDQIPDTIWQQ